MFIQLTNRQRRFAQRAWDPLFACHLKSGEEIDSSYFWKLPWYIIDHEYPDQPVSSDKDYPYSLQVMYEGKWYEIDAFTRKGFNNIMEVR